MEGWGVLSKGHGTGAWYWKGLATRTFAFERQRCALGHKLSKECLTVMCCGNASDDHKLKLVATGKAKDHDCARVPKQTAFMSIITTRKEHRWVGRFFKTGSTSNVK